QRGPAGGAVLYRFGEYSLDPARRELMRGREPVGLEPQVFDLLVYLVQNRDRVVTKDDLTEAVWHGRIVSESTLGSRINAVRKAIGDSGERQSLVRTIARKGVRFIGVVTEAADPLSPAAATERPAHKPRQDIRFCTAADGVRIAFAESGAGTP